MATWFVTGTSRGIGAEIARAAVAAGHDVVAAVRNPDGLPEDLKKNDRVLPVVLDVTDTTAIPAAVSAAVERFGHIDVLVNNAGRGLLGALEEITDAEARSLFDLNVFGLINMTRAVLPVMRRQGSGKLVHIGSRSGFEGEPGVSMYSASKFAVAGVSEALSAELAPFGIQSMVVEPGVFRTTSWTPAPSRSPGTASRTTTAPPRTRRWTGSTRPTTRNWATPSRARR